MAEELSNKRRRPSGTEGEVQSASGPKRPAIRKRAPLACEECRMRKRRCDGAVPICGGCTKRMTSCVYLAELQERAWQQDTIQSLRNRLRELEQAEEQASNVGVDWGSVNDTDANGNNEGPNHVAAADMVELGSPVHVPGSPTNDSSSSRGQPRVPGPVAEFCAPPITTSAQGGLPRAKPSIAAPMYRTPPPPLPPRLEPTSVERLMRPIDQALSETPSSHAAPAGCMGDNLGLGPAPPQRWSLPLRCDADELVCIYFARVHRMYPILHQPTFLQQYKSLWEPATLHSRQLQVTLDKTFPAVANAVFALASLFAVGIPEQNSARASTYFNTAQQINLLDIIDEDVGIELVQLLLLMGFYLQSTERYSKCWNITGLAVRMAQNMGLQLSVQEARRRGLLRSWPSQLHTEMRIRVWYGCVLLDREISMSFGRPLMITTTGGEQLRLPEAIDDEHLCEEAGVKRNRQPVNCPSMLEGYVQTIKLYGILGKVLDREECDDASHSTSVDTQSLLDLDTMIMEWRDSLPTHLQYDCSSSNQAEEDGKLSHPLSPENIPPTDFSAQARRLHARFLHVRVLILRPALEHLFRKHRHAQLSQQPHTNPMVARVQDLMLSDIAAQCVLSADSLVKALDVHIRSRRLIAWWYNVSCNTLLMGRLCSFAHNVVRPDSVTASWELCLASLSRYKTLSTVASKSYHLLQESARRLLASQVQRGPASPPEGSGQQPRANDSGGNSSSHVANVTTALDAGNNGLGVGMEVTQAGTTTTCQAQHQLGADLVPSPTFALEATGLDSSSGMDVMWASTTSPDPSYWPFMPFLSQLESLPNDLCFQNFKD
ncbi:fungal-specific transcription factor domain-containing protein [Podospora aff. communis PSN243]|uniref:Fungal-specific transcription factor domain-containing protein n=1 Tax=Podospora aff. communis PSN243 TaxID=3040156 RepID=A0AAV9GEC1_9PEZI|nr:fungal-specific transcription factor domain-containing protein [Podospora aff. communis PSN243]